MEDEFYFKGHLTPKKVEMLDKIIQIDGKNLRKFNKRLQETATMRGRECKDITLRDGQIKPMLMSLISKRFFIGDKPGLGKTVMSASSYANYCYNMIKRGRKPKKIIVVTIGSHVIGFSKEWASYGINLLPLSDGSLKIERKLRNNNIDEYDGIIINWDGLKTNGFLDYYLRNADEYDFAVFDETKALINNKSQIYEVVNNIVNKYQGGIERVIFLNGSSFEKNIFDYYNQFQVLYPKLIPTKTYIEERYVIRGGNPVQLAVMGANTPKHAHTIKKYVGDIVDYKNQDELREKLKYYYIARSKKDFSDEIPQHNYKLHGIEMTTKQRKKLEERNNVTLLNSPTTSDEKEKLTVTNSPKLAEILEYAEITEEDRPLIYVYNRESQKTIQKELRKKGYRVEIINGEVKDEEKYDIIDKFNNYKLDMLVFNVTHAVNVPTSDRILFYDIPTVPEKTNQIKGRIDRNNYKDVKFYNFFCYLDSPEMRNVVELACFREEHGSAFTGQEDNTYRTLVEQLKTIYGQESVDKLTETIEEDEDFFDRDDWGDIVDDMLGDTV